MWFCAKMFQSFDRWTKVRLKKTVIAVVISFNFANFGGLCTKCFISLVACQKLAQVRQYKTFLHYLTVVISFKFVKFGGLCQNVSYLQLLAKS